MTGMITKRCYFFIAKAIIANLAALAPCTAGNSQCDIVTGILRSNSSTGAGITAFATVAAVFPGNVCVTAITAGSASESLIIPTITNNYASLYTIISISTIGCCRKSCIAKYIHPPRIYYRHGQYSMGYFFA